MVETEANVLAMVSVLRCEDCGKYEIGWKPL